LEAELVTLRPRFITLTTITLTNGCFKPTFGAPLNQILAEKPPEEPELKQAF
jgi:hypothetical protein